MGILIKKAWFVRFYAHGCSPSNISDFHIAQLKIVSSAKKKLPFEYPNGSASFILYEVCQKYHRNSENIRYTLLISLYGYDDCSSQNW